MSLRDLFPKLRERPWVKICGVTRPQDAERAVELGATFVGVNFWSRSKRVVDPARAREIVAAVSRRAPVVGVFVNEDPDRIAQLFEEIGFDLVQLHGDEPPEVVARFGPRALRALRAQPGAGAAGPQLPVKGKTFPAFADLDGCFALLLDGPAGERYGGTGEGWDWSLAAALVTASPVPVLIAGGIRPETAVAALSASGADGVDVASGVETSPGVKDPERMSRLMAAIEGMRGRRGAR